MKASDLFLRCLEAQGVDTIFGVPGEENADIMISLLNSSIEFIVCRHETVAGFMAGMYGHLTGKPGVCLATLGPGATNLITGVANSNMDHAPVIAIIGQASTHRLHKESHQNMDAISMYRPVSKWAATIREADVIPEVISKAFKIATASKPGAAVIELPEDIAQVDIDAEPLPQKTRIEKIYPSTSCLERALDMIAESKKPLLLLGGGCVREEVDNEVNEFVDKTKIFSAVTFMGKGSIDGRNPQSLYCVGLGMKDIALEAFDQADLVICAGYDMVEWPPARWNERGDKKIIHIDTLPAEVDKNYIPVLELVGDIKSSLVKLNNGLNKSHQKDPDMFRKIRDRITKELQEHNTDNAFPVKPQRALSDIRSIMREDDILISDVGAHKMWVARQYPTYQSKTAFISNGFCSMTCAMPSAFVAKRMYPEKNVVALCGDGGFLMCGLQVLPTAVRYKVPMVIIVWEDDYYGLIKWKQEAAYHESSHVDLKNPDLVAVVKAFGCHAVKIESTDDLIPALEAAFKEKETPTVIVIPIDYSENMKLTARLGEIVAH